tara:strand:+ start:105 stop:1208 length:1104 start_codon:yes stop_codon:yes gene_type:complete
MGLITAGIIAGGAGLLGAYESGQQRNAAERAGRRQAEGVEAAQRATIEGTNRARSALSGEVVNPEIQNIQDRLELLQNPPQQFAEPTGGRPPLAGAASRTPIAESPEDQALRLEEISALQAELSGLQESQTPLPDPRQELLAGIAGQTGFTDQGFQTSGRTLSPLASMAQPLLDEQQALLGFGGPEAREAAIGRVADPLQAEQERAFMRNNARFGGVGGNALSALAEQTRARTEANIGNRLSQIGAASAPSLSALQQISNLQLNRGLSLADIMGGGGRDLASQETARRQALANIELGQGSELAQLAQNLGTARAGGAAFAAQNPSSLTSGLTAGLNAFTGMGGLSMLGGGATPMGGTVNPNRFGNIA